MARRWKWAVVGCVLALTLGACMPHGTVSSTGPAQPPRESGCDFPVLTVVPSGGYYEIGAIDFTQGFNGKMYSEVEELKAAIRADVCKAGGDAAIAFANGYGDYVKVTVIKRAVSTVPASSAPPAAPSASSTPLPVGAAAAADLGCHYDTQCKGDRVCNDGKCVPPSPTAPPPRPGP